MAALFSDTIRSQTSTGIDQNEAAQKMWPYPTLDLRNAQSEENTVLLSV